MSCTCGPELEGEELPHQQPGDGLDAHVEGGLHDTDNMTWHTVWKKGYSSCKINKMEDIKWQWLAWHMVSWQDCLGKPQKVLFLVVWPLNPPPPSLVVIGTFFFFIFFGLKTAENGFWQTNLQNLFTKRAIFLPNIATNLLTNTTLPTDNII